MDLRQPLKRLLPHPIVYLIRSVREWWRDTKRFSKLRSSRQRVRGEIPYPPSPLTSPKPLILFYPDVPPPDDFVAHKLCALLGYGMTHLPERNYHVAFKRRDATYFEPDELGPIAEGTPIINRYSVDISKETVNSVFEDIFGYSLKVDPKCFNGEAVVKSNLNNEHDGRIISCHKDEQNDEKKVYQKKINNKTEDKMVVDYRVPFHNGKIPLVYLKYKPVERRFGNQNEYVRTAEPRVVFSEEEVQNIKKFCSRMGIDYGELDVLRDNRDGRIYIVDANNTPAGPPNGLTDAQNWISLLRMASSFKKLVKDFER
jgi:hypothetical protein